MKKALPNTTVTVKLRRSNYKEEWYLIIESYPVYKRGSKRASWDGSLPRWSACALLAAACWPWGPCTMWSMLQPTTAICWIWTTLS